MNNEMTLTFRSRLENETFARTALAAFLLPLNPGVNEMMEIKTIAAEAIVNAMIHGYGHAEGDITLYCRYDDTRLVTITVEDRGVGIADLTKARQPFYTTQKEMERSGMGFTIMEQFSDSLQVSSAIGQGTTVVMTKQLYDGR